MTLMMSLKANLFVVNFKDTEYSNLQPTNMKDSLRMGSIMVKENIPGPRETSMRANIRMEKKTGLEPITATMVLNTKGIGLRVKGTEKAYKYILTGKFRR